MDLKIKYITTNVEHIMKDMEIYDTNEEKINYLFDIKSYLTMIATKLEAEIILPLSFYEKKFSSFSEIDSDYDFIIYSICSAIRTIVTDREKYGYTDNDNYSYDLLKIQIPKKAIEMRTVIKFIDEQIEILKSKIIIKSTKKSLLEMEQDGDNIINSIPLDLILIELEKLEYDRQLSIIKKVLSEIEMKYGDDINNVPMQIRILKTSLLGKQLLYRGFDSIYGATNKKEIENEISNINEIQKKEVHNDGSKIQSTKKTVPSKGLKGLGKLFCENLISKNSITAVLKETKINRAITEIIIPEIEKEYTLTENNKKSLHDYFRKGELLISKGKDGKLIVKDTYKRKKM